MKKNTVHLSLEFPIDEHFNLKMLCARQRKSIKQFVIDSVTRTMRECNQKEIDGIDAGLEEIKKGQVVYRDAKEFEKYNDA